MNNAFKFVDPRPVRNISFCGEASTDNKILGLSIPAIGSLDVPASLVCVELSFGDDRSESRAFSYVQNPVASVAGFRLAYKLSSPETDIMLYRIVTAMVVLITLTSSPANHGNSDSLGVMSKRVSIRLRYRKEQLRLATVSRDNHLVGATLVTIGKRTIGPVVPESCKPWPSSSRKRVHTLS
jgi:hypothetical protein